MNTEELIRKAEAGDMQAQYELAEYYGALLKKTRDAEEIYNYSKQAMNWLKKSAKQGYAPAVDAIGELKGQALEQDINVSDTDDIVSEIILEQGAEPEPDAAPAEKAPPAAAADEKPRKAPAAEPAKKEKGDVSGGIFSTAAGTVLSCLLAVSLIANALFLSMLIRSGAFKSVDIFPWNAESGHETDYGKEGGEPTQEPVSEPTAEPTAEPTVVPTVVPTAHPDDKWLDLSGYSELEFIPDSIYSDYVYYTVRTDGSNLNMRSGPDTGYESLTGVPNSTKVGAVSDSGGWYLIYYKGRFGWVYGEYLK